MDEYRILVTGASSGLGRDCAIFLSQLGASIILVGRDEEQLNNTLSNMSGTDHNIQPFDLNNIDPIPKWMKTITQDIGPLNGLVHCAGIEAMRPIKLIKHDNFQQMVDINVGAAIGLIKGFRQKNVNKGCGSIVLISSVAGLTGQAAHAEYCTTKAALIGLCRSTAVELARENIRVNCVAPGVVPTGIFEKGFSNITPEQLKAIESDHPLGFGKPRDVSNAIVFLLAKTGRWITGTTLTVDGGYTAL